MTLGEIIKEYRKKHKLSQDVIAARSGLSKAYISVLERNVNPRTGAPPVPSPKTINAIATALGCDFWQIFERLDEKLKEQVSSQLPYRGLEMPPPQVTDDVVRFRVNADIAAGYDQPAAPLSDWEGASVDIPRSALRGRPMEDYFVIRIVGNSMYPHYQNGDYVLVLKQPTVERSGDVAVLLCGEEGTIKKIEFEKGDPELRLVPLNPEYPPHVIKGVELEECRIIGVPRLLIRNIG